ncbi:MAG: type I-C CRISPR-associated endonuclease Cas1c [Bacteroidales bacterium]|nr:type I-C CRISPR-associated endonuclease Cas1c [Bacteroidales bacterium]
MRKLLNTLYVTTPDAYLSRDGLNVVVLVKNEEKFRIPIHNIEGIVTFGYMGASPALMSLCAENNVAVHFLTEFGKFCGRVSGPIRGNVLLRRQQYRMADNKDICLKIAQNCIAAKIANCRNVVHRVIRDHGNENNISALNTVLNLLNNRIKQCFTVENIDKLRGIEGDAANEYFSVFNLFILNQNESFRMNGRSRRPPLDNVNAMLSFCYVLLAHEVQSALETVGLDPYVGFLHTDRPGRPSLALDLMEELRPYLADRLVLSLINRKQVLPNGFKNQEGFGIVMDDSTRKEILSAWQKRKQDTITHPYINEQIEVGLIPYVQALLMARYIRGDIDGYPPFIMK